VIRLSGTPVAMAVDGEHPWVGPAILTRAGDEGVQILPSPWDPVAPAAPQLAALARAARREPVPGATARIGAHIGALSAKRVVLVGAGSVGSRLADELCRLGTGEIVLVDPDVVEASDLARTVYTQHDLGFQKTAALAHHLTAINPAVTGVQMARRICDLDLDDLLAATDLVIAALDDIPQLAALAAHVYKAGIPLVEVGIYRLGAAGQIVVARASADPMTRTACWNCTVGSATQMGTHRPPTNYGLGTLVAEPALGAAIGIITSTAATVCAGLLAGPGTPAGDALSARLATRRTLGIVTTTPQWDFVGEVLAAAPGQYAPQSVWVRAEPNPDCSVCGEPQKLSETCTDGSELAQVIAHLAVDTPPGSEDPPASTAARGREKKSIPMARKELAVKPNKAQAQERKSRIIAAKPVRKDKGQDSRKVHDSKGRNNHGRTYR
jgi:molybdopterin/thiamine biosynthesis adenylyltransferase